MDISSHESEVNDGGAVLPRRPDIKAEEHLSPTQQSLVNPQSVAPHAAPDVFGPADIERLTDAEQRKQLVLEYRRLMSSEDLSGRKAARRMGLPHGNLWRWDEAFTKFGFAGLLDNCHKSGRKPQFPPLTPEEEKALSQLFMKTNKDEESGSMMTATKFFALAPDTRDEVRNAILPVIEGGSVPQTIKRVLERITPTHVRAYRQPDMCATRDFSGQVGAFADDKINRRRVIESDDGTLNFACWIPWELGGDPCSDKFKVRLGRWQFLPAIEAGWSHMYLGYALICRPRGSYRADDIRALIWMLAKSHGLPDMFRFERGSWESNQIVDLLKKMGVTLNTVWQSNQKPYVEGGFSSLWTYLSVIDGQVGRYRGEQETENLLVTKCRAGRLDPREKFPSLVQCIKAVNGSLAMRNSDTIRSIYGQWVPEVRHAQLKEERPWRQLAPEMEFLFSPFVREWTVAKGTVGGKVPILEDYSAPFYFEADDLWRWNGHKVRVYFDPIATPCMATIVAMEEYNGYRPEEIICRATLTPSPLPHFCRAAVGWSEEEQIKQTGWRAAALGAMRRDLLALDTRGQVKAAVSESRDGQGGFSRIESGAAASANTSDQSNATAPSKLSVPSRSRSTTPLPTPEQSRNRNDLLAKQAAFARKARQEAESTY